MLKLKAVLFEETLSLEGKLDATWVSYLKETAQFGANAQTDLVFFLLRWKLLFFLPFSPWLGFSIRLFFNLFMCTF